MRQLTPEQALFLIDRYHLNLHACIFGFNCYKLNVSASPNGQGQTAVEAIADWCRRVWEEPSDRWMYNSVRRVALAPTLAPKKVTTLEDLGL